MASETESCSKPLVWPITRMRFLLGGGAVCNVAAASRSIAASRIGFTRRLYHFRRLRVPQDILHRLKPVLRRRIPGLETLKRDYSISSDWPFSKMRNVSGRPELQSLSRGVSMA